MRDPQPPDTSGLTKLTVWLTPDAMDALAIAARLTGDSKTDTVNRALLVYAHVMMAARPHTWALLVYAHVMMAARPHTSRVRLRVRRGLWRWTRLTWSAHPKTGRGTP